MYKLSWPEYLDAADDVLKSLKLLLVLALTLSESITGLSLFSCSQQNLESPPGCLVQPVITLAPHLNSLIPLSFDPQIILCGFNPPSTTKQV